MLPLLRPTGLAGLGAGLVIATVSVHAVTADTASTPPPPPMAATTATPSPTTITVSVNANASASASASASSRSRVTVSPAPTAPVQPATVISLQPEPLNGQAGVAMQTVELALATASNGDRNPADFTATVLWGDGSALQSAGVTASYPAGSLVITSGGHTYAKPGVYGVTVTVRDRSDNATGRLVENARIGGLIAQGIDNSRSLGDTCTLLVASFHDTDGTTNTGSFIASIKWGDGGFSGANIVTLTNGQLGVSTGCHHYAAKGLYHLTVFIADADFAATSVHPTLDVD